jgi:uncharacterized protein YbjT (DUF2867 family)
LYRVPCEAVNILTAPPRVEIQMPSTVLVTGATSTLGSEVVRHLAGAPDVIVHAGMREPNLASSVPPGVRAVPFDFMSESVMPAACRGVDRLFLLTPTDPRQVEFGRTPIHAARDAGVQLIVRLSAAGADEEPGIQLARWNSTRWTNWGERRP